MRILVGLVLWIVLMAGAGAASVPSGPHAGARSDTLPSGSGMITITPLTPLPGTNVTNETPVISASFTDSDKAATIYPSGVDLVIDGTDVSQVESFHPSSTGFVYDTPTILPLVNGNHTVTVTVTDSVGNTNQISWGFKVNTSLVIPTTQQGLSLVKVIEYVGTGTILFVAGFVGFILYLRRAKKFTFEKYFFTHPEVRRELILYVPVAGAFVFILVGLFTVFSVPGLPADADDYVLVGGVLVAITPYAIDARRELNRQRAFERSFAQFLFEIADAIRGGIDPAKALLALAETHQGPMRRYLRIAADNIELGQPFDKVLVAMVRPMRSKLIERYALLVADSSSVGGDTAAVIYRAAKDMDDFVKIEAERGKQLTLPVGIVYVAYGVMIAILFALLWIAPSLGSINLNAIGSGSLSSTSSAASSAPTVPPLDPGALREQFFQLALIMSVGNGILIGAFTEGKPKYGLVHSIGMVIGTIVAFAILLPIL